MARRRVEEVISTATTVVFDRCIDTFSITDYGSSDTELDDDDIENMLDEGLPEELKGKKKETQYEEKFKTVLDGEWTSSYGNMELIRISPQRKAIITLKFCPRDGCK